MMMTEKEALQAAEFLRKWCMGRPCEGCVFQRYNCGIGSRIPANWTIPKRRRWSDADIELAESLMAFGYEKVVKEPDTRTYTTWAKSTRGHYEIALNPCMFGDINKNETVLLRDVIKEKEQ